MIKRILSNQLQKWFFCGKAIILVGARQTGKTTLVKSLEPDRVFNFDDPFDRELVEGKNLYQLKKMLDPFKLIFFDEAHKVKDIGTTLKLLVDTYKQEKQFIVTASSSVNLLDNAAELLTGRKITFELFPLSLEEMWPKQDAAEIRRAIPELLLYGNYPEIVTEKSETTKKRFLKEISSDYLYKDILEFQLVKNSSVIRDLVRALALQIGNEVSYAELHTILKIDPSTIERYVDLLEKSHVVFRLSPYARNVRRAISRLRKIYFYDLGVRNAAIDNFNVLESRNDAGALWENFLMIERIKFQKYRDMESRNYFLRTYDGTEMDWIEEREGQIHGYEFKFKKDVSRVLPPPLWRDMSNTSFMAVNIDNFLDFIN